MDQRNLKVKRFSELDSLRGIAAIFVVIFHLTMWRPQSKLGFNLGVTGVDLFFLISGFVIFKSLENNVNWKTFVAKRIARLYPAYWVCVTFTFLLILSSDLFHDRFDWYLLYKYLVNLYMIQYYFNVPDLDGPYWTMIIELLFYVFILIVIITKSERRIIALGIAGLISVSIYSFVLSDYFPDIFSIAGNILPHIKHFPLFFAGILFYKLRSVRYKSLIGISLSILIFLCFFVQLSLYNKGAVNNKFVTYYEYAGMLGSYFITFFLFNYNLLKYISSGLTIFLGEISYSLYLVHQHVCLVILLPFFTLNCGMNFWAAAAITLSIVIILAALITFYIEKPLSAKMKKYLLKYL